MHNTPQNTPKQISASLQENTLYFALFHMKFDPLYLPI